MRTLSETSSSTTNSQGFDWQDVLDTWNVNEEQDKAEFLDVLYKLYSRRDGTYTGLWQQFQVDAALTFRDYWAKDKTKRFVLSTDLE